jgi:hypothetical protein
VPRFRIDYATTDFYTCDVSGKNKQDAIDKFYQDLRENGLSDLQYRDSKEYGITAEEIKSNKSVEL